MRIELDQQEIVAILTEWGKTKYGTHNVSLDILTDSSAILSISLSANDFGSGSTKITMEKFGELVKKMKHNEDVIRNENEPELPNFDNATLGAV